MTQQKTSSSEEKFYDLVGKRLVNIEDLSVGGPARFLAGSMDAFNYMLERLGFVQGKRILDYGCGSGWLGVYLAKQGAQVNGFDISGKLIEVATQRVRINGVEQLFNFQKMPAENLEYPDKSFDLEVGISILHYVELPSAISHLERVMREAALAIFLEPLGENPILNWLREKVFNIHYEIKKDKTRENPLTYDDIHYIGRNFSVYSYREYQPFSMVRRVISDRITDTFCLQEINNWLIEKLS